MQVAHEDLNLLLKLQTADMDAIRTKKELAELPQIAKMSVLSAKHKALDEKANQVEALKQRAESEITRLTTEDGMLADKQRHAQELIDNAGGDYRSVESHSKEMSGFAKRREELDGKLSKLAEELQKIEGVQAQLKKATDIVANDEAATRASYEEASAGLRDRLQEIARVREGYAADLPKDLLGLYTETARHTGGIAVGKLVDDRCGICRSPIEGGRLIDLKAHAPLGVCPNCKRLLVIE